MDTSAELEPLAKRLKYEAMFQILRLLGFRPLMGSVMGLMFLAEGARRVAFVSAPK